MNVPFQFQLFIAALLLLVLCINDVSLTRGKCLTDQQSLLLGMKNSMVFDSSASTKMLSSLSVIYLDDNNLSSAVPGLLAKFSNLTTLSLSGCPLSFSHFGGLSELKHVNLGSNLLSGKIPPYLFSLPSLRSLYLNKNLFHGQLNEFANASASRLDTLDLGSNSLYGSIPMSFFNLSKLNQLSLSFNFFSGKMQLSVIERLSDLRVLELSYNNLTIDPTNSNEAMFSSQQFIVLRLASYGRHNVGGMGVESPKSSSHGGSSEILEHVELY
nr:receptor-like protein 12 [Ipomoea batatas]